MIRIKLLPPLSRAMGAKQLEVEASNRSLRQVLTSIADEYPSFRAAFFEGDQPSSYYICKLNGEQVTGDRGWETVLIDGDEVLVLAPIVGG